MFHKLPIYHIASMARSGETLLLKLLYAHTRIHVCHNLFEKDSKLELELFNHLRTRKSKTISIYNSIVRRSRISRNNVIVIKQGVWSHDYDFNGFVLVRNPLAIFSSLWRFKDEDQNDDPAANWVRNTDRMIRWLGLMNKELINGFEELSPEEQFIAFYNQRANYLASLNLPIFKYENLIEKPEVTLSAICEAIGLEFENEMLSAHLLFKDNPKGHGGSDLSRKLDSKSTESFTKYLTTSQIDTVISGIRETATGVGYKF